MQIQLRLMQVLIMSHQLSTCPARQGNRSCCNLCRKDGFALAVCPLCCPPVHRLLPPPAVTVVCHARSAWLSQSPGTAWLGVEVITEQEGEQSEAGAMKALSSSLPYPALRSC